MQKKIVNAITNIQLAAYLILMIVLTVVTLFSLYELIVVVGYYLLFDETPLILEGLGILAFFEFFLLILIGLELMDTIKSFIETKRIEVGIVIILAIIAISRKIIVINPDYTSEFELVGIGAIVIALTAGYYFVKKADALQPANQN
ncbi:MAG: phosphate-starvation-inducible PsiE family protein [Methanomicrobium sp.]|nr:phosphate-starvation-inducible PsiE family protein [Methanomicrobium sp.]MDD4300817.1 phosphate-starvation-inducible PsiE family protein [Methanomicrobium sp.]